MSRVDTLMEKYEEIRNPGGRLEHALTNDSQLRRIGLARTTSDWLDNASGVTGHSRSVILNHAVRMAAFRQFAIVHSVVLDGVDEAGATWDIPALPSPFVPKSSDVNAKFPVLTTHIRLLDWMKQDGRDMSAEDAVHDGLRILGALAVVSAQPRLIANDSKTFCIVETLNLAGVPPLAD